MGTMSRRDFLRISGGAGVALAFVGRIGDVRFRLPVSATAVPGSTLDPALVAQFVTPLLIPPVMPRAGTLTNRGGKPIDVYEISVEQFSQQVLPAGMPPTTVWGYGPIAARGDRALMLHHAPSLTIEARVDRPVRVTWRNRLVDPSGAYLAHLLPVDPTLHWANPAGGRDGRDSRPVHGSAPERYTGPVPIVTHVHGALDVGDESDGYAEAWYLPAASNIPEEYATAGTWYDFFAGKAAARFGVEWEPGSATFQYPDSGRAATTWYHDHALGMTRLNVYAGPAGFFILRGGPGGDQAVLDSRTGKTAVLPGPAPREGDKFPPNKNYREIPVAIQDRAFNDDGSLFYPDSRAFFDGVTGPYLPETDVAPIWNPEFFGNMIIVNGSTWPFLAVEQCRYRFRVLNGCQSRFLILDFSGIPGVEAWAIGNDGGLLSAAVNLTADNGNRLLLSPAERADLILDFTNTPVGDHVLANVGPDEPFAGGEPPDDFDTADPDTTGRILQFRVRPAREADPSTPPPFLLLPALAPQPPATRTRRVALIERMSEFFPDAPAEALLGTVFGDPGAGPAAYTPHAWADAVTENPDQGDVEIWEVYNTTGDAHPVHVHEVAFVVVDRQAIAIDDETGTIQLIPGTGRPPELWESGAKDTVVAYPGEVIRLRIGFDTPGQYVWHCHIVEHEDNEMMRPYRVGPVQIGQPG
ncbi:multicopper oxidase family protein [Microbacterium sp. E-13]|uniref:multicopper oxidase family protein n=1 Tax=Microbacterium sp. E-13 TaxID=3404048 RepID=UPI003CEBA0D3